jgi:hypothetical protein
MRGRPRDARRTSSSIRGLTLSKSPANVRVEHPVHALPLEPHGQRVQRLDAGCVPAGTRTRSLEVHLVNLIEDGHHGLLNNLVLQRRDAQRTLPPVGLRYIDSSRGLRPVRSTVYRLCRSASRSSSPVSYSCHVSRHPLPAQLPLQCVKAVPEQIDVRWCSKAVNRSCFLSLAAPDAHRSTPGTRVPRSVSGRVDCAMFSLICRLPSPPPPRLPFFVRLVHRYYAAVRLLRHVHVRLAAMAFADRSLLVGSRRSGGLPVLVHEVSQRARGLRLRRTGQPLAITRLPCCLPPNATESAS